MQEKVVRRSKVLTREQLERLYSADLTPWQRSYLKLYLGTGMRPGELLRMEFSHIDFDRREIFIPATKHGAENGTIPMSSEVYEELLYLKEHLPHPKHFAGGPYQPVVKREARHRKWVFCHPDGSQVKCIRKSFRSAMRKAGIQGVTPQGLRRSFCTFLREAGHDPKVAQKLLRHKDVKLTLEIYTEASGDSLRRGVESVPTERDIMKRKIKLIERKS